MGQKASGSEKKASSKKSLFTVQLTRKKLFLGLGVAFVSLAWMFTLGVLVGRDLSPVRFDVKKIKKELIALKQKALKADQTLSEIEKEKLSNDPELGFYEVLTDKKKEAELKFAKAPKRSAKIEETSLTAARASQAYKKEQIPLKLSAVDKQAAKLDKTPPAAPKEDKMEGQGLLTIQVASLKDLQEAKQMVDRLKRKGYQAYEVTAALGEKGTFHRVRVGRFADSDKASQVAARLKRENFEIMILRE